MNDLTTKQSGTSPAKRDALPDAVIERLFQRLEGMYMARWLDSLAGCDMALVKRTWADGLADVSPEAMKHALDHLKAEFPPSLPTFRELCRQFRARPEASNITLLSGPRERAKASAALRSIHQILNMPNKPNESAEP